MVDLKKNHLFHIILLHYFKLMNNTLKSFCAIITLVVMGSSAILVIKVGSLPVYPISTNIIDQLVPAAVHHQTRR